MESSSYLTASRLYLISKAIYNKLNAGTEGDATSVKVMVTTKEALTRTRKAADKFIVAHTGPSHYVGFIKHRKHFRWLDVNGML